MSYVAQLLPDRDGAELLRKLLLWVVSDYEASSPPRITEAEVDAAHELYAKLTKDMRGKR